MHLLGHTMCSHELFFIFYTVLESFKDYIKVETLDGDNKYDAGENGLQVSQNSRDPLTQPNVPIRPK